MSHLDPRVVACADTAAAPEQEQNPGALLAVPALLVLFVLASGCAYTGSVRDYFHNGLKVGPEYCKPEAPVADVWLDEYDERVSSELPTYGGWWNTFNDPQMSAIIEDMYRQNLTLKEAGLRVLQARYQRQIAVGSFFPQAQSAFGEYTHTQISVNTVPTNQAPAILAPKRAFNQGATGLEMLWELDVWGKFRRNIEAADASLNASVEEYDAILVALLAEAAATYVDLRTFQERLRYANENVIKLQRSLEITNNRRRGGATTELDPVQAQLILSNTEQLVPLFENQIRLANNRLCVLLGIPPRDLTAELGDGSIPTAPPTVAVGIPANLLRRRPDVRAAERQVAAQSARIGVAAADLLPHVSVAGVIQAQSEKLSDLFEQASTAGTVATGFSWDILNYGRLANNVNLRDARFQELAIAYQQTVLQANEEAENAINSFLKSQDRLVSVRQAVVSSERSVVLATIQYENESDPDIAGFRFNRLFTLQGTQVNQQDALATNQGEIARSLIAIYKALGGGWEIRYGMGGQPLGDMLDEAEDELPSGDLPPVPEV